MAHLGNQLVHSYVAALQLAGTCNSLFLDVFFFFFGVPSCKLT